MGNPLVAQAQSSTTWYTGLGLVEDVAQVSSGIHNNSWVDGTLGTVGGALDILGMAIDPIGSLVAWGVSWLMEHVKPLKDALDWLAGNPDVINAHAQTWGNVSKFTEDARAQFEDAIKTQTAQWVGDSGDAYRAHAGTHLSALEGISKAANGISYAVMGAGLLVGLVRGIVRDLIAQFIATLAARLPQWLAEEGLTLGLGTPVVIGQVVALVSKWVNKIQKFVRALLNSLKRLRTLVSKLGDILVELRNLLKKLGRSNPMHAGAEDLAGARRWWGGKGGTTLRGGEYLTPDTAGLRDLINPGGGTVNCRACALAVDSTLAGAPASALPSIPAGPISVLETHFGSTFKSSNLSSIVDDISKAGPGARGIVYVGGKGPVGHVFNVYNDGGKVVFLDGQTGTAAHVANWKNYSLMRTN